MSNPSRLYWDTNTWLDWLTGEAPNQETLQAIYDDWKAGQVHLVTSSLTLAQIYFVRVGTPKRVDRSRDNDIDALFDPPPERLFALVELSRSTAIAARSLSRTHSVSWDDAIHIASALEARCEVLHTGDDALWTKSGLVGGTPPLRIEAPSWTKQLELTSLTGPNEPPLPPEQSQTDAPE